MYLQSNKGIVDSPASFLHDAWLLEDCIALQWHSMYLLGVHRIANLMLQFASYTDLSFLQIYRQG